MSSVTVYQSPVNNGDYLAVVNINEDPIPTPTHTTTSTPCNIIIVDVSGSMGDFVNRICNKILPDVFKRHQQHFSPSDPIHLINFASQTSVYSHSVSDFGTLPYNGSGGTNMGPVYPQLQKILEKQPAGTFVRILTLSDGDIQDQDTACRLASELYETVKEKMNLTIDSTAIRLFSSSGASPSTAALASILQLNSTPSTPTLIDIPHDIHLKGELEYCQDAAAVVAHHFGSSQIKSYLAIPQILTQQFNNQLILGSNQDLMSPNAIFKKDPWSDANCALMVNKKRCLFWLDKAKFDSVRPQNLTISDLVTIPLTMSPTPLDSGIYEELISSRVEFYLMSIKLLRVVGTPKAIAKLKEMANYFIELEKALYPEMDLSKSSIAVTAMTGGSADDAKQPSPAPAQCLSSSSSRRAVGFDAQEDEAGVPEQASAPVPKPTLKSRFFQLKKATKADNCRLGPKLAEIANDEAINNTTGTPVRYCSNQAANYLRSTRATNLTSAGPAGPSLSSFSSVPTLSFAAPPKRRGSPPMMRAAAPAMDLCLKEGGNGADMFAEMMAPSQSMYQQAQPLAQAKSRKKLLTSSSSSRASPSSTFSTDPTTIVKSEVIKMVKNLDKLEAALKSTPDIETKLKKSWVSEANTLDGIRAVCSLARTTLQGEDIHLVDIGQRESVLDTLEAKDVVSFLNIVGVPVQHSTSNPQSPYDYTITKIFPGHYCSISDLMVTKEAGESNQLYIPGATDTGRIDNVIPLIENELIGAFLMENAPMTMAMASSWGISRQFGTGHWSSTHAAMGAGLKMIIAAKTDQVNIEISNQLVNGLALFEKLSPTQSFKDEVSKAKKIVADFKQ